MDPIWTLAVCTHNRSPMLERCLAALKALQAPVGLDFEILVVLNACTDNSRAVLDAAGLGPNLRVVELPEKGIARARNAAVQHALGQYLAFLDDDVIAPPEYLVKLDRARAQDPECVAIAGPLTPIFLDSPPTWVLEAGQFDVSNPRHGEYEPGAEILRGFLVDYSLHGVSRRYGWGMLRPFSANMAFHVDMLRTLGPGPFSTEGPFVPHLGKGGAWDILGEDTEIWLRLEHFRRPRRYVNEIAVEHLHERSRLTIDRLLHWSYQRGAALTFLRYAYPPFFGSIPGFDMLFARMTAGPEGALPQMPLPELIANTIRQLGDDPRWEQLGPHVHAFDSHGRHAGLALIAKLNQIPAARAE